MASQSLRILAWPAFENTTGNPYTRLLYEAVEARGATVEDFSLARAVRGGYDLWHVHWPDDFLSYRSPVTATAYVAAELLLMAVARQRGTRIVWTIHDLGPHESRHPWLERLFWRAFLPLVDGTITLSAHARDAAHERFPVLRSVPNAVVPHGHYRPAYPEPVPQAEARAELGLSEQSTVAAYVGRIRPYKNVSTLVQTFRRLEDEAARLLVTGNPDGEALEQKIREAAAGADRVQLDLRFIPTERIPVVLGAADLVVLPYRDIMHSGSALMALSFDRPVLVPERGAMAELQAQVGGNWVFTYEPPLTTDALREALQAAQTRGRTAQAPLDDRDWDVIAEQTLALYDRVCSRP